MNPSTLHTELLTARLRLRPVNIQDTQAVFQIFGDARTQIHNPAGPIPDVACAEMMTRTWLEHWDKYAFGQWAVEFEADPSKVAGFVGATYRMYGETQRLNLGYRFSPSVWGRGIATEASARVMSFAFLELAQPEIFALVRPSNLESIRVLEKLGMIECGVQQDVAHNSHSLVYSKSSGA